MHGDPVSAAAAVARAHGLRVDEPVVLREAWHVLVHLAPAPVVARVTSGAPGVDPDDVERELRVAVHAARRGASVIEPSDLADPGPHEHDGRRGSRRHGSWLCPADRSRRTGCDSS